MLPALPSTLRAGDTIADSFSLSDYQAPTWVLSFVLINSTTKITATCSPSGEDHVLAVPAATSAEWAAGTYSYTAQVVSGANRYTVNSGSVAVLPDLSAATTYDNRTANKKALDAAEVALAAYGAKAYLQGIRYGDREQSFTSAGDFLSFVSRLRAEVSRETNAERISQGLASKNKLLVRFTR